MIKSFYTGNKKGNIFTAYKYHDYKLFDFAMAMVRVNGFSIGMNFKFFGIKRMNFLK